MARFGWSSRANFLPSRLSAPCLSNRFSALHRTHWRCLCAAKAPLADLSLPTSLKAITVVDNTKAAIHAVQALLELPLDRRVSWNTQLYKPSHVVTSSAKHVLSASAYAGDDVDFGNGPHLFVSCGGSQDEEEIWRLLRRYFQSAESQKVWFDYGASMRTLAMKDVRPAGFSGDIVHMAQLYRDRQKGMEIGALAKALLSKVNLAKCLQVWEKNDLSNDQVNTRVWEAKGKLNEAVVTPQWIARACCDASLTHRLDERLRKLLQKTPVHGDAYNMFDGISALQRNEDVYNLMQAYEMFFQPIVEAFYAIEVEGLSVDLGLLQQIANEEQYTKKLLEDEFRRWASTFSSDAKYMDLNSSKQLRQLLFAPCDNIHNRKDSLPPESSFKVSKLKSDDTSRTNRGKKNREILLKGAGIKAMSHTKQGWPSMSTSALHDALDEYAQNPSGKFSPGFPNAMKSLLQSIELGRRLKWYGNQEKVSSITDKDGRVRMRYKTDFYTGHITSSSYKKDWEPVVLQCFSPQKGNDMIHIEYPELEMWTLAQLSGCTSLRGRLNSRSRSDSLLAYELFLRSNTEDHKVSLSEVSDQQCHAASMMDEAIYKGGEVNLIENLVGCAKEEAVSMMKAWYDLHPGVSKWRKGREAFITKHGFAETYMGRRRKVRRGRVGEAVGFVINGTAAEIVMGGVISLRRDERISALGWHIVHAARDGIYLEGPTWSTDSLLEFLEKALYKPTGFELCLPPRVTIHEIVGEKEQVESQIL